MLSTIRSVAGLVSPAFWAAVALVAVQVGMGILFKAVQTGGEYTFSISASITISEFFKFCLSTIFFYQTCWTRHLKQNPSYQRVAEKEPLAGDAESAEGSQGSGSIERSDENDDKTFSRISFDDIEQPEWAKTPFTPLTYLRCCRNELDRKTIYGYGHLALLYATINNTVFVLFKVADPGTIQLIKSGITLITALVLIVTLGTKITRLQWVAIGLQICGLIVTQYHPGTGTTYPLPTYGILFFQTFVAAVAGVYNQNLLKSHDSSMHAQNMVLYAFGVLVNFTIHQTICVIKPHEPTMFQGFDHIGPILVVISSVLNGLIITAVYKYADAIVKCFATAFSTAILLYISPLLFNAKFSFLIVPGTAVVFIATWLYMDAAPPKKQPSEAEAAGSLKQKRSIVGNCIHAFTPRGILAILGLFIGFVVAISGIAGLNLWDTHAVSLETGSELLQNSGQPKSPFENTVAFIRYQSKERIDRFPFLAKYEPFFHTVHNSIPQVVPNDDEGNTLFNMTLDTYDDYKTPQVAVARMMEAVLNNTKVEGLLFYHFDAWINPFEFATMDFQRIWFPDSPDPVYRCFTDPKVGEDWLSFHVHNIDLEIPAALAKVNSTKYKFDPKQICQGWADIFYVPRRFFEDFIYLSDTINTFHEAAVPTLLNIIDTTYRTETDASLIQMLGDCWGSCCHSNPTIFDVTSRRCGHRLDYRDAKVTKVVGDRLDHQATLIGNVSQATNPRLSMRSRRSPLNEVMLEGSAW